MLENNIEVTAFESSPTLRAAKSEAAHLNLKFLEKNTDELTFIKFAPNYGKKMIGAKYPT